MLITKEIFLAYLACKYKAYCKLIGKHEIKSGYEVLQLSLEERYRNEVITSLATDKQIHTVLFKNARFACTIDFFEKAKQEYIPILFKKKKGISQQDKLLITFQSFLQELFQGKLPLYGTIISGDNFQSTTIQTYKHLDQVKTIINHLENLREEDLHREDYCRTCDFCKAWAKEKDDLSLLQGLSNAEIKKLHTKGIFTVTQFSYVFRPKKRRKRVKEYTRSYVFALKALAIREKKILIYEKPILSFSSVEIYFDIEGTEDNNFHYLIGLIIKINSEKTQYSLWADNKNEEEIIFQQFIYICLQYSNFILFHYGSYETNFLKNCKKKYNGKYDKEIDILLTCCVNILSFIYTDVFFPTYSNRLKDIGNYLKCSWSEKNASGIESVVWRTHWELTQDKKWKNILLQYNNEDCLALEKITNVLYIISSIEASSQENKSILWAKDIKDETNYGFGNPEFFFPELAYINKCAYFNYQREKVFIRTEKTVQKTPATLMKKNKNEQHITHYITIESPSVCPVCQCKKLYRRTRYHKIVYDIQFLSGGLKKIVTKYTTVSVKCSQCSKESIADAYKIIQSKYGHGLISYVIYQILVNGISLERIAQNLSDLFALSIASSTLYNFKTIAANYYRDSYQNLYKSLREGKLIHADETKVNLKTTAGYVWVFTNMESVIFVYKDSREGNFLHDFLAGFQGVLITDYYAGYDALRFPQQKCLIHLIRDLNRDLFQNQLDEELKNIAQQFTQLLQKIIQTVDTYGLKKWHLQKHKKHVDSFFEKIKEPTYKSEVAKSYQKRFEKNKDKLFTFLDYDGIPWNNNNAEHAFKHFATYRKINDGIFTKSGIEDYLILLSIYQTCQYKNSNFLQFLLSKKKIL